jgi:hypothetical protein
MHRARYRFLGGGLVGLGLLATGVPLVATRPPAADAAPPAAARLDRTKSKIETPVKDLAAISAQLREAAKNQTFVNPKVAPGKVRWHADLAAACRAAQKSGKPVLLFQMMGKLDDQFC